MNASLVIVASNWYQELMKSIPDGQNFSLRSVFDALPRIIEKLPTTLFLTLGGALFGLVLALIFAIVKINRVKVLYPVQALFVSFLRGTPILVQLMLTYYGIPIALKVINQRFGTLWELHLGRVATGDWSNPPNSGAHGLYWPSRGWRSCLWS